MSSSLYNGVDELERGGGGPAGLSCDPGGVRRARASGPARRLFDGRVREGGLLSLHSRVGNADRLSAATHRRAVCIARGLGVLAPDGGNPDLQRKPVCIGGERREGSGRNYPDRRREFHRRVAAAGLLGYF